MMRSIALPRRSRATIRWSRSGGRVIISMSSGIDACTDIIEMLSAVASYNDGNRVPYAAVPIPGTGFYNSNSFTSTF